MAQPPKTTILDHFADLDDPRVERTRLVAIASPVAAWFQPGFWRCVLPGCRLDSAGEVVMPHVKKTFDWTMAS